jgi:serine protease inhibitor
LGVDNELPVAVNEAKHAARVMIDEEGCTAAAYTVMLAAGAARPPEEKVDFVLDRPFLFVINGQDGQPLFVGIVNQPK